MVFRFTLKSQGIGELLTSPDTRSALGPVAEDIASAMRANAPVETGTLAASVRIEDDTTDRAVKRVVAGTPYAMVVEANTGFASRAVDG